jgi:hypothetical protein
MLSDQAVSLILKHQMMWRYKRIIFSFRWIHLDSMMRQSLHHDTVQYKWRRSLSRIMGWNGMVLGCKFSENVYKLIIVLHVKVSEGGSAATRTRFLETGRGTAIDEVRVDWVLYRCNLLLVVSTYHDKQSVQTIKCHYRLRDRNVVVICLLFATRALVLLPFSWKNWIHCFCYPTAWMQIGSLVIFARTKGTIYFDSSSNLNDR